ncbi:hypothetical protein [Streptomyces scopuliridis]|uniref:hypothetical protein n=1 Tax=Streptomyces scopuliridis TaxID=452529 RepID=UPI001057F3E1|nr:hypothetical protein [Streptomyces scopuliridis]
MAQKCGYSRFQVPKGRALRWAACGLVAVTGVSGCNQKAEEDASWTPASKVCQSTLDTTAAAAPKKIAGTDEFTELTGTNDAGEPNKFSLKLAAKHLHGTTPQRNTCTVYKADDKSGHPLIDVDFEASVNHPDQAGALTTHQKDRIFYPMGVYARTDADSGADLFFRCPTKGAKGDTKYVNGSMFTSGNQLEGDTTSKDLMTILNSVSRHLAAELGCSDEAQLPSEIPAPVTR